MDGNNFMITGLGRRGGPAGRAGGPGGGGAGEWVWGFWRGGLLFMGSSSS